MNKQKVILILFGLLALMVALIMATSSENGDEQSGDGARQEPVAVSKIEALNWAATRVPQFFWIEPEKGEALRIDPSTAPEEQEAVAFGILDRQAQKEAKRSPLVFTYLVQSFVEKPARLTELKASTRRAALYTRSTPRWVAFALPRKQGGKEILSVSLFSRDAPVVGRIINASQDRSLSRAKELIQRAQLVYPPNG